MVTKAANSLKPMLRKSLKHVPQEMHEQTLVILKATAGLRLLPQHKADAILNKVSIWRQNFDTNFHNQWCLIHGTY